LWVDVWTARFDKNAAEVQLLFGIACQW
jgi:hypothetical protein